MDELRCAIEIRETDGRARLVGTLLRYGEVASDRRERFAKGALTWPADGVVLREQHDRSQPIARVVPVVRGDEVVIDALLPDTQRAKDAATMIREGVFRGLSVDIVPLTEEIVSLSRRFSSARVWSMTLLTRAHGLTCEARRKAS